jgi:hypothetical protein
MRTIISTPILCFCAKALLIIATLLLSACSSGGNKNSGDSSRSEFPKTPPTYRFYMSKNNEATDNGLYAIDPENPTDTPIMIESGGIQRDSGVNQIAAYEYDQMTQEVKGYYYFALVYTKTDGKLYKVNPIKSGSLTPERVSSETEADSICKGEAFGGRKGNLTQTIYVYFLSGPDETCYTQDDIHKMVRLDMGVTDAPILIKTPIDYLANANASLSTWLVWDQDVVKRCDTNFSNCVTVPGELSKGAKFQEWLGDTYYLIQNDNKLYIYNQSTNNLSPSLYASGSPVYGGYLVDATHVYFSSSGSIYKIPRDGSAAATPIDTEPKYIDYLIGFAGDKLIYVASGVRDGAIIKSLNTKTLVTSDVVDLAGKNLLYAFLSTADKIFYGSYGFQFDGPLLFESGSINVDGSGKVEQKNSRGFPLVFSNKLEVRSSQFKVKNAIQISNYDTTKSEFGEGNSVFKSFDEKGNFIATLGSLPKAIAYSCEIDFSAPVLCAVHVKDMDPLQSDIYFLNSSQPNSLVRITNTSDVDEILVR